MGLFLDGGALGVDSSVFESFKVLLPLPLAEADVEAEPFFPLIFSFQFFLSIFRRI